MKAPAVLLIVLVSIIFISCEQNNDHFSSVKFGQCNAQQFIFQEQEKKLLLEPGRTSNSFRYFLTEGSTSFPVEVCINPDYYDFGTVRQIEILLGGDSIYKENITFYARALGPRLKQEADSIYDLYTKWYGSPDSVTIHHVYKDGIEAVNDTNIHRAIDPLAPAGKTAFWQMPNFKLTFDLPIPTKNQFLDSAYTYHWTASILYEVNEYDNIIKLIRDSIKQTLRPNDIISIQASRPKWINISDNYYDTQIEISITDISRLGKEEPRLVTGIRFDIILSDIFDDELCRMEDFTFELPDPLWITNSGVSNGLSGPYTYTKNYYSLSDEFIDFETARRYATQNSIKTKVDVKAVVFNDGNVLR